MGVVNVTPDSFSDGGRFDTEEAAVSHGLQLFRQGAAVLDIGGESTRPGSDLVDENVQKERVLGPVERLVFELKDETVDFSIDTTSPAVARAAVAAGASIWNDVSALRGAPESADVAASLGCRVVLMHMRGEPRTMQDAPAYDDVVSEVEAFLLERAGAAMAAGVARSRILLDPGIGFGKRPEHSLALLAALPRLCSQGWPVVLGCSRKRFIQAVDRTATDPLDRLGGSLAAALRGAQAGVAMVRVHDVRETAQALAVWAAIGA